MQKKFNFLWKKFFCSARYKSLKKPDAAENILCQNQPGPANRAEFSNG
jgi:hypothetical protein